MLYELTGFNNSEKMIEYKRSVMAAQQYDRMHTQVNAVDTFIGRNEEQGLGKLYSQQEKKLLNKPTGEDFSAFLKRACDAIKKK